MSRLRRRARDRRAISIIELALRDHFLALSMFASRVRRRSTSARRVAQSGLQAEGQGSNDTIMAASASRELV